MPSVKSARPKEQSTNMTKKLSQNQKNKKRLKRIYQLVEACYVEPEVKTMRPQEPELSELKRLNDYFDRMDESYGMGFNSKVIISEDQINSKQETETRFGCLPYWGGAWAPQSRAS